MAATVVLIGLLVSGPYHVIILNTGLYALSGGITNWLAVHMLFERIPGFYGSGVIPLRFEEFKVGIRSLIMEQFFHQADLEAFFHGAGDTSEKMAEELKTAIETLDLASAFESLLDVIMTSSLGGMLGMVGGRSALDPLRDPFVEKMREYFKDQFTNASFQQQIQQALRSALDDESIRAKLEEMIDDRLDQMTPKMVKEIVQQMIHKHLGWLVVWGCVLGGIIGLLVSLIAA